MLPEHVTKNLTAKKAIKRILFGLSYFSPVKGIPVFMYHSIDESGSALSVSPTVFQQQMTFLKNAGYRTISFNEFFDVINKNRKTTEKSFVITFDDGYQNNYTQAFPALKKCDFRATIFLVTDRIGTTANWTREALKRITKQNFKAEIGNLEAVAELPMLSWDEIREMDRYGIDFGVHTCSHPFLSELTLEAAAQEIRRAKEIIEKNLARPIDFFSYPYGDFTPEIKRLLRKLGFSGAFTDTPGMNNGSSNPYTLKRVPIGNSTTLSDLRFYFSPGFNWYLNLKKWVTESQNGVEI